MGVRIPDGLVSGKPWFYAFKGGGSDKFWGGFPDAGEWVCVWGRNGRPPQGSKRMSEIAFKHKAFVKVGDGYVRSPLDLESFFLSDRKWFAKAAVSPGFSAAMESADLWEVEAEAPVPAGVRRRRI